MDCGAKLLKEDFCFKFANQKVWKYAVKEVGKIWYGIFVHIQFREKSKLETKQHLKSYFLQSNLKTIQFNVKSGK